MSIYTQASSTARNIGFESYIYRIFKLLSKPTRLSSQKITTFCGDEKTFKMPTHMNINEMQRRPSSPRARATMTTTTSASFTFYIKTTTLGIRSLSPPSDWVPLILNVQPKCSHVHTYVHLVHSCFCFLIKTEKNHHSNQLYLGLCFIPCSLMHILYSCSE